MSEFSVLFTFCMVSIGSLIAIGAQLIFKKSIDGKSILCAVIFGCFYEQFNALVHHLYIHFHGNNQYSTVVFMAVVSLTIVVMSCSKTYRSFDRIFFSIISTSVLVIWFMIHLFMIHYTLIDESEMKAERQGKSVIALMANKKIGVFYDYCEANELVCQWQGAEENKEFQKLFEHLVIDGGRKKLLMSVESQAVDGIDGYFSKTYTSFSESGMEHTFGVSGTEDESEVVLFFDIKGVQKFHSKVKTLFYAWFDVAIIVWFWGGLGILFFHKNRFKKRRR